MRSGEFKPAVPQPPVQFILLVSARIQACLQNVQHTLAADLMDEPFILHQQPFVSLVTATLSDQPNAAWEFSSTMMRNGTLRGMSALHCAARTLICSFARTL